MGKRKNPDDVGRFVGANVPAKYEKRLRAIAGPALGALAAAVRQAVIEFVERHEEPSVGGGKRSTSKRRASKLREVPAQPSAVEAKLDDLGNKVIDLERRRREPNPSGNFIPSSHALPRAVNNR